MQKIDGFYLYQVGGELQKIKTLEGKAAWRDGKGTEYDDAAFILRRAKEALTKLLEHGEYRLKTSVQKGTELKKHIEKILDKIRENEDKKTELEFFEVYDLKNLLEHFETVLSSELALLDLYVITKKGNYDISGLMKNGEDCFPKDLAKKVPECILDIKAGAKCIAVSLPTAAGFHLLRANEAVLRRYWDVVTEEEERPKTGMGEYIAELKKMKKGNPHVIAALENLKNLHRNELIHPGDHLENVDEAIALMHQIHTVIVYMLKEIPEQKAQKENYAGLLPSMTNTSPSVLENLESANTDGILSLVTKS